MQKTFNFRLPQEFNKIYQDHYGKKFSEYLSYDEKMDLERIVKNTISLRYPCHEFISLPVPGENVSNIYYPKHFLVYARYAIKLWGQGKYWNMSNEELISELDYYKKFRYVPDVYEKEKNEPTFLKNSKLFIIQVKEDFLELISVFSLSNFSKNMSILLSVILLCFIIFFIPIILVSLFKISFSTKIVIEKVIECKQYIIRSIKLIIKNYLIPFFENILEN